MRVRLAESARREIREAAFEYEAVSVELRQRFFEAVRSSLRLIRDNPELFAFYEGATTPSVFRRVLVTGFPYVIAYRSDDATLSVVAVAHTSRRPGYWERA